jgi:hypothetical protein
MGKIYIGFSYPKEFKVGAKAIAWWTGANYSHVYLRFESSKIPSSVYHAAHGMVHFRSLDNFSKENYIIKEYEIELGEESRLKTLIRCMNLAGEKYGTSELVKIFISDVAFAICGKLLVFKDSNGYICSELVGELCRDVLEIVFKKPLFLLKPTDIDAELSKKYQLTKLSYSLNI